jgi:hypothetical protein
MQIRHSSWLVGESVEAEDSICGAENTIMVRRVTVAITLFIGISIFLFPP